MRGGHLRRSLPSLDHMVYLQAHLTAERFCRRSNKFFETFSYLPPLSEDEIAKQVDYIVNNGFIPTLEFAEADQAYAGTLITRLSQPGYYDNR